MPARAAYAAADADVLPVDAQMIASAPSASARVTATVMPRSLNEPVGFCPSHLSQISMPGRDHRRQPVGAHERRVALVQGDDAVARP